MKENLLILTSTFPRWDNDNVSPFVGELALKLAEKKLFNVSVLAPFSKGSSLVERKNNITIYRYRYQPDSFEDLAYEGGILPKIKKKNLNVLKIPLFIACQFVALIKIVRKENIHIIHAHWLIPQGLIACVYRMVFNRNIRVVVTAHGSDVFGLSGPLARFLRKFTINTSDHTAVVSHALKKSLEKTKRINNISILPMGIDFRIFRPSNDKEFIRNTYSLTRPIFLFVGRLAPEKGVDLAIRALHNIQSEYPSASLLIVGTGPLKAHIIKTVKELGIRKSVEFAGFVDKNELPKYYSSCDILMGPSLSEGLGLALAEALACRCNVIASDLESISEVIKDNKTGLLFKKNDPDDMKEKAVCLLKDSRLSEKLKNHGEEFVRKGFSWESLIPKYTAALFGQKKEK